MPGINELRENLRISECFPSNCQRFVDGNAGCKLVVLNYHAQIQSETKALLSRESTKEDLCLNFLNKRSELRLNW